MINPAEVAERSKKESEDRKEAAKYRFPEGQEFEGKIITAEDGLSPKKKTPCYMLTLKTKEKRSNGKRVDVIVYFMKDDQFIGNFYSFLELAGADLNLLKSKDQAELDGKVQNLLDTIEDTNPKVKFACVHQVGKDHNSYYINECQQVLAVAEVVEEPEEEPEAKDKAPKTKSKKEAKKVIEKGTPPESNSDSAFDDDDD